MNEINHGLNEEIKQKEANEVGKEMQDQADAEAQYEQECLEVFRMLESKDVFDHDFRLNASLTWKLTDIISLQLYGMNLIGSGNNKRYIYDAGVDFQLVPNTIGWIEEPRAFGLRFNFEL